MHTPFSLLRKYLLRTFAYQYSIVLLVGFIGCNDHHWTDKQIDEFREKCSQTNTFGNLVCLLRGFDNNEFDSIVIRELNDTIVLDSFKVFVWPAESPDEKARKERSLTIVRTMNINYTYEFVIPGQRPYVLSDMKMVMWSEYPGYGCVMGDFSIDGVPFEHVANPTFNKNSP